MITLDLDGTLEVTSPHSSFIPDKAEPGLPSGPTAIAKLGSIFNSTSLKLSYCKPVKTGGAFVFTSHPWRGKWCANGFSGLEDWNFVSIDTHLYLLFNARLFLETSSAM